jgi:coenzyme PQQ precursor peptide PqqA
VERWLRLTAWCKKFFRESGGTNMNDWKKPEFVEIRMDAEINCYSSALADDPRARLLKQPVTGDNGSETSHES